MARPRTVEDDDILNAAERAISERGASTFSIESVALPLGVTPQAILRRFGSKQALVLAIAERRTRRAVTALSQGPNLGSSPLEAMVGFFERRMSSREYNRKQVRSNFGFMLRGLEDESVRPHLLRQAALVRANLRAFLAAAIEAGELEGDADEITALVESLYNGALYVWAMRGRGSAWSHFGPQLELLLSTFRPFLALHSSR
jgi:AcrR family transcriptional regulator